MDATQAPLPGAQAPLPGAEAALIGLVILGVLMIPLLWAPADHLGTMAHEGAHAIMASAMGFTLLGVLLEQDASGVTGYLAPYRPTRLALTSFAGYLGPSAFGLGAAKLIETGHAVSVLWIAVIFLVLLLTLIRRSFGIISVPAAIALLAAIGHYAHQGLEEVTVYAMTWMLLLAGARTAIVHGKRASDALTLSTLTPLPRRFWSLLWIAGTLLAVAAGGKWLVLRS